MNLAQRRHGLQPWIELDPPGQGAGRTRNPGGQSGSRMSQFFAANACASGFLGAPAKAMGQNPRGCRQVD